MSAGPVTRLASFHRRRIAIPVGPDDLVLDVGSGDKPHWRADVLVDRHPGAAHGGQRSGRAAARVSRPLFDADAAAMPFADGAFDYVVCSHVLEHVADPAAVVTEMTRVGRAGYIEVPEAASAKILDFPSHLWWCRSDGATLRFTAKTAPAFDAEIAGFVARAGLERRLARLLDADFDRRVIARPWRGTVAVEVDGTVDQALHRAALAAGGHHAGGQALAARALTWAWTLPLRHGPRRIARRRPVTFDEVVAPQYRRGTSEPLEPRIYRL